MRYAALCALLVLAACTKNTPMTDLDHHKVEGPAQLARLRSIIASAPTTTRATLVRGTQRIAIDLAKDADWGKVRDLDIVELEAGRYTHLGKLRAAGLRFVGKGEGQTFINTGKDNAIYVDGSEFWDVTLLDSTFAANQGRGFFAIHCYLAGTLDVQPIGTLGLSFGYLTSLSNLALVGPVGTRGGDAFSYGIIGSSDYANWGKMMPLELADPQSFRDAGSAMNLWKFTDHYRPYPFPEPFFTYLSQNADKLAADVEKLAIAAPSDNNHFPSIELRQRLKQVLPRMLNYLVKTGRIKTRSDESRYQQLVEKAQQAFKKNNDLVGLALLEEADRVGGFQHHDEVAALAMDRADAAVSASAVGSPTTRPLPRTTMLGSSPTNCAYSSPRNFRFCALRRARMSAT